MTTGLLVVDMLNDFMSGTLANPAAEQTVVPIAGLLTVARDLDWVVLYGNDAHHPGDIELRQFGEHAMQDTTGAQVIDPLKPEATDLVVPKRFYSAFTQTDLLATIRARGIDRLVIAGQHTDCCVRHTAYDAFVAHIPVTVVAEATAVYGPGSHEPVATRQERALGYLHTYYGTEIVASASELR
ncbi:MAG TPA: isochorismatase family cysteine hydrolase [Acidimicrobiales bacterium]|nr:isochorismatase family cysteine hydrolase [Acidimicrobiales bacterium]